ncbi:MAG: mechanosensitive ion channel family protein [Planctomycetota bacterium]
MTVAPTPSSPAPEQPGIQELPWFDTALGLLILLTVAVTVFYITRFLVRSAVSRVVRRTSTTWDDHLLQHGVFARLSLMAPFVVLDLGIGFVPAVHPDLALFVHQLSIAGLVLAGSLGAIAFLGAINTIYTGYAISRDRPIKGYLQIGQILIGILGGVFVIANLVGHSPWSLLTGIGAMTAVVLLIFKDTILGLVASVQLAGNRMIRVGDWITVPAYGADGDVADIALHTVTVRNFDKTIVYVPTHKLIEGSFQNWRGMQETGGRRIKRALHIDLNSVRFLSEQEIERFSHFERLRPYIEQKRAEIAAENETRPGDKQILANIRALTNIGTFRAYIAAYLRAHPQIHEQLTFLVRQLDPGPSGVPLELYVFTTTTVWAEYEGIQADIFDHLLAIMGEFDLRPFQQPSGRDLAQLGMGRPV